MLIPCLKCGRPLVDIVPPSLESGQMFVVKKMFATFGIDATEALGVLTDPTPEGIAKTFNTSCPNGNCR